MDGDSVIDERCDHHWYLRLPLAHLYFWSCHFKIVRNIHTVSVAWNIFQRSFFEYLIVIDRQFEGQIRFAFVHSQKGASHSTSCLKFSLHTRLLFNASFLQASQILKNDRSNLSVASNSPVEIPPKISVWVQDQRFHLKAASSRSICLIFLRDPRVEPSLKDGIQNGPSPRVQDHHQRHQLPFPLFDFDTRSLIWRLKIKDGIQRVPPPLQFPGQAA